MDPGLRTLHLTQVNMLTPPLTPMTLAPFRSLGWNKLGPEVGKMIAEVLMDPKCKIHTIE